jgi:biopolymer transport protein ExbD
MHSPGRVLPAGAQNKQGVFAMRKRHSDSGADEAAIDLTPMLDIVFIMLIFFIVTTSFVKESGVEINRPSASTAETVKKGNIMVAVRENGQVWVDKRVVEVGAVRANIERLRAENPESAVVIQADTESRSGLVVQVMDQIRMAGVQNISIAASKSS